MPQPQFDPTQQWAAGQRPHQDFQQNDQPALRPNEKWRPKKWMWFVGGFLLLGACGALLPDTDTEGDGEDEIAAVVDESAGETPDESTTTTAEESTTTTGGNDGKSNDENSEPASTAAEELVTEQLFADGAWEAEVQRIVESDSSLGDKSREIDELARGYNLETDDLIEQGEYLIAEVKSRNLVAQADNKAYLFRAQFIARSIDRHLDDSLAQPIDGFAFDFYQIVRDLARETESPDGNFVQANLQQLDRAIQEQGW